MFVSSGKIINTYNDKARKYGNVTVKDFWKYEKLKYKKKKKTQPRHWFFQQLQTTWCVSQIPYL